MSISLVTSAIAQKVSVKPIPGKPVLLLGAYDPDSIGYAESEYFLSGRAKSYAPTAPLKTDGRWHLSPNGETDFTTRIVVLRPKDAKKFNGTVIVEWLNVSGGLDAPADWFMAHREIVRAGYAYAGVSAQKVGVEGGISLGTDMSLKKTNPERYSELNHPGDAFAYDMFSQAGWLVRQHGSGNVLGPMVAKHVIAAGESQSATFLASYINGVDPLAKVFDGFLVHSRFGSSAPFDGSSVMKPTGMPPVVKFRPDLRVPVLTLITETDLVGGRGEGYSSARQKDAPRLRAWEVAGAAHADVYTIRVAPVDTGFAPLETLVAAYKPSMTLMGAKLAKPYNFGPQQHYVLQAALSALNTWVQTGKAAPSPPQIALSSADPNQIARDEHGLAIGGIRTPWVDVPVAMTSGSGNAGNVMAYLFGSGEPFDDAKLNRLYPGGKADYLTRFAASLDSSIRAGFILRADRQEILDLAAAIYPVTK